MVFTELGVLHSQIRILPTSLVNVGEKKSWIFVDPRPSTEADLNGGQWPKAQRFKPTSHFSPNQEKEDSQKTKNKFNSTGDLKFEMRKWEHSFFKNDKMQLALKGESFFLLLGNQVFYNINFKI